MVLFRRKKSEDINPETAMPQELQDYYQAETRERTWMAWLLGLATLVVTVVIALGLFYGGRWVYRTVTDDTDQTATVQQEEQTEDEEDTSDDAAQPETATTQEPASTPAPAPSTSSTSTSTLGSATQQPAAMPSTGPADTLAVFAIVSLAAYFVHRRYLTR